MQVTFRKLESGQCAWDAVRGKRTRIPGTTMGGHVADGDLPHDLAQFVAEATLGLEHGFWGLVAAGATFKSTGRKRTRPGRRVIADHRADLTQAEHLVNAEVTAWRRGLGSATAEALDAMAERWRRTTAGGTLVLDWPP